jgi:hypothetical protein
MIHERIQMLHEIVPGKLKSLLLYRNRVREKTIQDKKMEVDNAVILRKCWYKWGLDVIFLLEDAEDHTAMMNASTIFGALAEASYEIEDSIFTAIHGSYKQAMTSLRSASELPFLGLYYYDHGQEYVSAFIEGKSRTTSLRKALDFVFGQSPYKEFDAKFSLQQEILEIHDELSRFTHSRGSEKQELKLRHKPPAPFELKPGVRVKIDVKARRAAYSEELFDKWYYYLSKASLVVNISLILKYPNILKNPTLCAVVLAEDRLAQLKEVL